jgi:hypothetical protein
MTVPAPIRTMYPPTEQGIGLHGLFFREVTHD